MDKVRLGRVTSLGEQDTLGIEEDREFMLNTHFPKPGALQQRARFSKVLGT